VRQSYCQVRQPLEESPTARALKEYQSLQVRQELVAARALKEYQSLRAQQDLAAAKAPKESTTLYPQQQLARVRAPWSLLLRSPLFSLLLPWYLKPLCLLLSPPSVRRMFLLDLLHQLLVTSFYQAPLPRIPRVIILARSLSVEQVYTVVPLARAQYHTQLAALLANPCRARLSLQASLNLAAPPRFLVLLNQAVPLPAPSQHYLLVLRRP
jgi:hypothetical protein